MNPWIAKALVLAGTVVMIAIRAPHGHRNSFRSRARPTGRWQFQPSFFCKIHHTCPE
jgi:hypothetical protein